MSSRIKKVDLKKKKKKIITVDNILIKIDFITFGKLLDTHKFDN